MSDYISRQAAIEAVEKCQQYKVSKEDYAVDFAEVKTALMLLPPADVVEVVRCKDCKWFHRIGCAIEISDKSDAPTDNDYCSFGERADK